MRLVLTRGGRRLVLTEPLHRVPGAGAAGVRHLLAHAHPGRRQVAVVRRQHARHPDRQGARLRRCPARHPARARARAAHLIDLLGDAGGRAAARRRSRTTSSPRSRATGCSGSRTRRSARARARICWRRARRSWRRASARCSRWAAIEERKFGEPGERTRRQRPPSATMSSRNCARRLGARVVARCRPSGSSGTRSRAGPPRPPRPPLPTLPR